MPGCWPLTPEAAAADEERAADTNQATEDITHTDDNQDGKHATRWNHLNKTAPKWTYGTTGPRQTPTTGTAGPYRDYQKVNQLLQDPLSKKRPSDFWKAV